MIITTVIEKESLLRLSLKNFKKLATKETLKIKKILLA